MSSQPGLSSAASAAGAWNDSPPAAAPRQETAAGIGNQMFALDADTLIAGTALAHNATLATRNLRAFARIPKLSVVNWFD